MENKEKNIEQEKEKKKPSFLEPNKIHELLGDLLEFIEDLIVLSLVIFIFIISIFAIAKLGNALLNNHKDLYKLIAHFIYIFILVELFRLTIIYLKERRLDTSLMVKTTLIAILREIIIKAPTFKLPEYIGVSILVAVLALMYYIPKYVFVSERKFELRNRDYRNPIRPQRILSVKIAKKNKKP
jgi:uncharacterized membrane protein (DUF373 family)